MKRGQPESGTAIWAGAEGEENEQDSSREQLGDQGDTTSDHGQNWQDEDWEFEEGLARTTYRVFTTRNDEVIQFAHDLSDNEELSRLRLVCLISR